MKRQIPSSSTSDPDAQRSAVAGAVGVPPRKVKREWGDGTGGPWTLDLGVLLGHLQADAPRVNCFEHGPTVAQVPRARHGPGHT